MTPNHPDEAVSSARGSRMQARYADLLDAARDDGFDPADQRMLDMFGTLDTLYTAPTAPQRLSRFERHAAPIRLAERWRLLRTPGVGLRAVPRWVAIVLITSLVAVLGVTGSVYALSPQVNQIPGFDPGRPQVVSDNQFTQINQSQQAQGYMVTLVKGYADANNIILVYTVTVDGSHLVGRPDLTISSRFGSPTVRSAQGATLTWTQGAGSAFQGGVQADALWFDAAPAIADDGQTAIGGGHSLRLQFHSVGIQVLSPSEGETYLKAPMTFLFTLPLRPGRVAHPHLAVHSAGATLTLDTVVVSATATSFYLAGLNGVLPGKYDVGNFAVSLALDGRTVSDGGGEARHGSHDVIDVSNSFVHFHGRWTLTLTSSHASPAALHGGKWVFNFVVP